MRLSGSAQAVPGPGPGAGTGRDTAPGAPTAASAIADLEAAASGCVRCRLARDRTQVVCGGGAAQADVVVVAEAPGFHEDRAGELLVGNAGRLFDDLLTDIGMSRELVYLTSVVKCRPPRNRSPFPDEVEACEGWLFRQLAVVRPHVVITFGAVALRLVTGRHRPLGTVHGTELHAVIQGRDVTVWPVYHPAAALHVPNLLATLKSELRQVPRLVRESIARNNCADGVSATPPIAEQPSTTRCMAEAEAAYPGPEREREGRDQLAFDLPS